MEVLGIVLAGGRGERLMDWVEIGRGCRIKNAIIDKYNTVEPGTEIGYDRELDRERFYVCSERLTIMPRAGEKQCWSTVGAP